MRTIIKKIAVKTLLPVLRKTAAHSPKVLFYHGVEEKIIDGRIQKMHLDVIEFEKQIKYLHRHYKVISANEYERQLEKGFKGNEVVLTFDDGYRNNLTVAAPILDKYKLPFSVYPSVAYIGTDQRCPTFILRAIAWLPSISSLDIPALKTIYPATNEKERTIAESQLALEIKYCSWEQTNRICEELVANIGEEQWEALCEKYISDRILSWDELKQLPAYGCEIGSHGMEHGLLHDKQNSDFVKRQARRSMELLNEHIGNCRYYVYPNGGRKDVSPLAEKTVQSAGFHLAFSSVTKKKIGDKFFLPRIGVGAGTNLDALKLTLVRN